jgi:hypothetical protein
MAGAPPASHLSLRDEWGTRGMGKQGRAEAGPSPSASLRVRMTICCGVGRVRLVRGKFNLQEQRCLSLAKRYER